VLDVHRGIGHLKAVEDMQELFPVFRRLELGQALPVGDVEPRRLVDVQDNQAGALLAG
jgi:hypothetical protein